MRKAGFYILWLIVAVLALNLVLIAASYMTFDVEHRFLNLKDQWTNSPIYLGNFYIHLLFGMIAVVSGFVLFFNKIVSFKSKRHRQIGKLYMVSILLLTGPTGLYLSFFAEGGAAASIGFILMSSLWMFITYMGLHKIMQGDINSHYKWMIRSYCFTLSGITLRIMTPLGTYLFELDAETNFVLMAYLPWIFNILLGEVIVHFNKNQIKNVNLLLNK